MNVNDAYALTMSIVDEIAKSGIKTNKVQSRSKSNTEVVKKYKSHDRISPDKWYHVTFSPTSKAESRMILEKARYLGNLGVEFDTGGGKGQRDWELDWSFRCDNTPDTEREEARDQVEDIIENEIESKH